MRAKMSNTHGLADESRGFLYTVREDRALSEARAILRETEPGTDGWGDIPYVPFGDERAALAESLAAFLED